MTDEAKIIDTVLEGEVNAFEPLIAKYEKPIFNLMYRATGSYDEAIDRTQKCERFLTLPQFQRDRNFFNWLYAMALNIGKDYLRYKKCKLPLICDNTEDLDENDDAGLEDLRLTENYQSLLQALGRIPTDYREAIVLHYREGRSMKEVAEILNLSLSGAKMRVSRGLEKLWIILGDKNYSPN